MVLVADIGLIVMIAEASSAMSCASDLSRLREFLLPRRSALVL